MYEYKRSEFFLVDVPSVRTLLLYDYIVLLRPYNRSFQQMNPLMDARREKTEERTLGGGGAEAVTVNDAVRAG